MAFPADVGLRSARNALPRHGAGALAAAELLLGEAFALAEGADRVTAAAWLGVLRSHQSRTEEALSLLRPAARGQVGVEHTAATLHSLLFSGHAHALAGYPAAALDVFSRYTAEVERRQVPRFAGRAVNFAGWVLRNLGASDEALDHHQEVLEIARSGGGSAELAIAALEDLAEHCVDRGDLDGAAARLAEAAALIQGDLVFGWRLELKHDMISGRLALGRALRGLASARLDVSDGLMADLGHIAAVSKVHIAVEAAAIPRSAALRALWGESAEAIARAATSGDDYELAFTAPASSREPILAAAAAAGVPVTEIGHVEPGEGVHLLDETGVELSILRSGWTHF